MDKTTGITKVDAEGLAEFIEESLENRNAPYKWIWIGTISNDAQKRIEQKYGAAAYKW